METDPIEALVLSPGDRVVELPGSLSQRCGTVRNLTACKSIPDHLYPVIIWDSGAISFSSFALGLRLLKPVEQLNLFS